jgi:hypothetical protein
VVVVVVVVVLLVLMLMLVVWLVFVFHVKAPSVVFVMPLRVLLTPVNRVFVTTVVMLAVVSLPYGVVSHRCSVSDLSFCHPVWM